MEIAMIASDKKKELMSEFCIAYCGILSRHNICATARTGKFISDATGLDIQRLRAGEDGGKQQIASRVAYNEIDVLLYFRDASSVSDYIEPDEQDMNLLRLCDLYNVPVATNIGTAEALILALDRGDLDWRMYMRNN